MKLKVEWVYVGLAFAILLWAYNAVFGSYFPLPNGLMGHDYALTLPAFEDGYLWFRNNGFLTPPWFTPSFCAGQPYFADPQSIFYSIPQFMVFVSNPLSAVYASILLFAGLGFWGSYVLGRRTFGLSIWSALVVAIVFMFNGFYSHRMIVGHFGYQPYMLVPWVAWLLIGPSDSNKLKTWASTIAAGLLIAYWLQAGLTTLMVPAGLSVVALGCLAVFRDDKALPTMILRGMAASLIALGISAAKLSANIALMSHFARDYYPLPGIDGFAEALKFIFEALFYSSEHVYQQVTPYWRNMQWAAMPHELAYGITIVPLVVLFLGGALRLIDRSRNRRAVAVSGYHVFVAIILGLILVLPLALIYYTPGWNSILKQLPLIGSTTSPFRWLIIYIPVLAMLSGMAAEARPSFAKIAALLCVVAIPALNALENREFYQQQNYDPTAVLEFDQAVRSGSTRPAIHAIAFPKSPDGGTIIDNSLFTQGLSPLVCYNPLFGYRQEKYSVGSLGPGDVFSVRQDEYLNFRNPACLVFPSENQCSVWSSFERKDIRNLEDFVDYKPFSFKVSVLQRVCNVLSEVSLFLSLSALMVLLLRHFFGRNWLRGV